MKKAKHTKKINLSAVKRKEAKKALRAEKKAVRAAKRSEKSKKRKQNVQSILSGSFLADRWARKLLPYFGWVALIVLLHMAGLFHLQKLYYTQQKIEQEIELLSEKAVNLAVQRTQQTQRSAIVRQLDALGVPLREFDTPLKTIEVK
jgi:hypothetical protein